MGEMPSREQLVEAARRRYGDVGKIHIHDDAGIKISEYQGKPIGAYVQAWVFVCNEDCELTA